MIAFMDESLRRTGKGLYLLALAIVVADDLDGARDQVRSVLRPRQPRFHWRNDAEPERTAMLAKLAQISQLTVAGYACQPLPTRQERARALCLQHVTWDLSILGVSHLVIESREPRNDKKDAASIEQARRTGKGSPSLTYSFERPKNEPLLWLADAACGAISAQIAEGDSHYLDQLPSGLVTVTHLRP